MYIETHGCCVYNVAVICWKRTDNCCASCGWNPVVARKRKDEYKEHPVDTSKARLEMLRMEIERAEKKLRADQDQYYKLLKGEQT